MMVVAHKGLYGLLTSTKTSGPLFTKRADGRLNARSPEDSCLDFSYRKIHAWIFPIALKYDSNVAEMPVKFQSGTNIITSNPAASRLKRYYTAQNNE